MIAVGLPVTLEALGLGHITRNEIMELAEQFVGAGSIAHNHVQAVTAYDMFSAMVAADALGHQRRAMN
jgi:glycerol dehydrogenase